MPGPQPKPDPEYTPPEPVEESPPLMDATTFKVLSCCVFVDGVLERLEAP